MGGQALRQKASPSETRVEDTAAKVEVQDNVVIINGARIAAKDIVSIALNTETQDMLGAVAIVSREPNHNIDHVNVTRTVDLKGQDLRSIRQFADALKANDPTILVETEGANTHFHAVFD